MFRFASTERTRKRLMRSVIAPKPTSFSSVRGVRENLRIVMHEPRSAMGRMTAFTREPSFRRASTSGEDSSMRRPSGVTMRSMTPRTRSSSVKRTSDSSRRPPRST